MPPRRPAGPVSFPAQLRGETELRGVVERTVFASDDGGFQVVRFRPEGEEALVTLAGNLPGVTPGEPIHVRGEWKLHRQHGPTFEVESYLPILPESPEMIAAYLGSGLVKGIGPSYAKRIVDHFGADTLDVLDHAPERLAEVSGLGRKRGEAVTKAWQEHRQTHEIMMVLAKYGLSPALARRLFRHYGAEAAGVLKANPYRAGTEVHGVGFATADRIAAGLGIARDAPERIAAALAHVLVQASDDGNTCLARETLLSRAIELLGLEFEAVERVLDEEVARARQLREVELPDGRRAIFLPGMYLAESGAARLLRSLLDAARPLPVTDLDARLDAFEARFRFKLAAQQRDAIRAALRGGVTVVTGGPGTGKTTLVRALLHVLDGAGVQVALCSPTGRAAQRLAETTHRPASTIHRLLKFNAQLRRFTHGPDNPLPHQLLIADESSMLDVPLAYHLLGALRAGTAVVFVGDADQLPSVGPGNVLHDLIASGRPQVVRLNVIFRQASRSAIIVNSHRINEGRMPDFSPPAEGGETDFFFIERNDPQAVQQALVEMVGTRIPRRFGFDPVTDVQVLTPMRRGELGTNELNRLLQEALNPGRLQGTAGGAPFAVGDKVIQNSNNYDLEVFNGDVGRVVSTSGESMTFRVVFGNRPVEYRWDESDQLTLAYAVTIHKSQGSEYPAVVVLLHTQHYVMLRRNLLYTAVTRGKKLVVLIGNKRALRLAIEQDSGDERLSALAQWLVRPPGEGRLAGV
jgi:exodeoxyribonuclease V alpha subunit